MLRLVGAASFRSFRNLWMLEELGVAYEHVPATPLSPEARAHNPFGKVPALHDREHDFTMYESAAINTYLGDKFASDASCPRLVPPAGTPARGLYEQTVFCIMTELDAQGLWIHRKHETFGRVFGKFPEAVAHAKATSGRTIGILAKQLQQHGGPFLLGPEFTAADVLFVHSLNWAEDIGWGDKWQAAANLRTALKADKVGAGEKAEGGGEGVDPNMVLLDEYLHLCRARPAYRRALDIKEREENADRERKAARKKQKQEQDTANL